MIYSDEGSKSLCDNGSSSDWVSQFQLNTSCVPFKDHHKMCIGGNNGGSKSDYYRLFRKKYLANVDAALTSLTSEAGADVKLCLTQKLADFLK